MVAELANAQFPPKTANDLEAEPYNCDADYNYGTSFDAKKIEEAYSNA